MAEYLKQLRIVHIFFQHGFYVYFKFRKFNFFIFTEKKVKLLYTYLSDWCPHLACHSHNVVPFGTLQLFVIVCNLLGIFNIFLYNMIFFFLGF